MNHLRLSILVSWLLIASSASGQDLPAFSLEPDANQWIQRATAAHARGDHERAADAYLVAAAYDAQLSRFLRYQALTALLEMPTPPRERVARLAPALLGAEYDGAALTSVRSAAVTSGVALGPVEILESGLDSADREDLCTLLDTQLEAGLDPAANEMNSAYLDLHHAFCADTEIPSRAEAAGAEPTIDARIRRADRLYGQVRFYAAAEEIEKLGPLGEIEDPTLRCRAQFRMARTLYRIRKRRSESEPLYKIVAETCTAAQTTELRKSALYAVGKRRWDLDDAAGAKVWFETLIADYPDKSHADDALLYLARVARATGDRPRELALLERAQADYRDGDMFGEIAWEVLEPVYRAGDYADFVTAVEALDRPEHDDHYYSQGRLEYFLGQAKTQLGDRDAAKAHWRKAWQKYPWSFYGYVSRMRLADAGEVPSEPQVDREATPAWLDSRAWRLGALGRLFRLGDPTLSAAYAAAVSPSSDDDRWRIAYVQDRVGRYHVSHNIVRRRIDGRPWSDPLSARLVQWRLAWPDPFGEDVDAATEAETEQAGIERVRAGLSRAIMREESSFIEDIESYAGALGLMQLMPRTALGHDDDVDEATPDRLKTAALNIRVGVDHLFWLAAQWDDHPVLMVAAYNAGSGRIRQWMREFGNDDIALFVEDIPSLQTRGYTKRVIGSYAAYQWLAGRSGLDDRVLGSAR